MELLKDVQQQYIQSITTEKRPRKKTSSKQNELPDAIHAPAVEQGGKKTVPSVSTTAKPRR